MPHECTNCGRVFPDGSTEMLSGCPECGGTKFQYHPETAPETAPEQETSADTAEDTVSNTTEAVTPTAEDPPEDAAQSRARSTTVDPADLPAASTESAMPAESDAPSESTQTSADADSAGEENEEVAELRTALNDQFESIKIVSPGEYELNLMELYDRDEHIISLMEDGRYAIDVPGRRSGEQ